MAAAAFSYGFYDDDYGTLAQDPELPHPMATQCMLIARRSDFQCAEDTFDVNTRCGYAPSMTARDPIPLSETDFDAEVAAEGGVGRTSTSYAHDKAKIMARLRRIEGQVRGVQRMVEEDQYCLDVLTQLSAIIAASRQTGLLVLEDHVRGCVASAIRDGDPEANQEELLTELIGAIDRFGRTVG
jgi:DNA-binding FrmR family transcriptional regulator